MFGFTTLSQPNPTLAASSPSPTHSAQPAAPSSSHLNSLVLSTRKASTPPLGWTSAAGLWFPELDEMVQGVGTVGVVDAVAWAYQTATVQGVFVNVVYAAALLGLQGLDVRRRPISKPA
jgi:hypothetical protein